MIRRYSRTLLLAVVFTVAGCADGGLFVTPTPETPAEALAQAEIDLQEQAEGLGELADAGVLTFDQAVLAMKLLNIAHATITTAREAIASALDPAPYVAAARSATAAILAYARETEARKKGGG